MARPAKSNALHALQGTDRRVNLDESHVEGALPRPPKSFHKELKKKFRSLVKQLAERRAVTAGDSDLISIYCGTWQRLQQALKNLEDEGLIVTYTRMDASGIAHDVERPNISLKIVEVSERACLSYLGKLGLTPKDREGVKPTAPKRAKREQTVSERLEQEIAALEQQEEAPDDSCSSDEDLLDKIDECGADEKKSEAQVLLDDADRMLAEEEAL